MKPVPYKFGVLSLLISLIVLLSGYTSILTAQNSGQILCTMEVDGNRDIYVMNATAPAHAP